MLKIEHKETFIKKISKIKDKKTKEKIIKQIEKIIENPTIGKPMKFTRKGTRELYVQPYRISYAFLKNTIIFLDFYHKDKQ